MYKYKYAHYPLRPPPPHPCTQCTVQYSYSKREPQSALPSRSRVAQITHSVCYYVTMLLCTAPTDLVTVNVQVDPHGSTTPGAKPWNDGAGNVFVRHTRAVAGRQHGACYAGATAQEQQYLTVRDAQVATNIVLDAHVSDQQHSMSSYYNTLELAVATAGCTL